MNPADRARFHMAYRLGQLDNALNLHADAHPYQTSEFALPLAIRQLRRLWMQYKIDRQISARNSLLSSEIEATRAEFLSLVRLIADQAVFSGPIEAAIDVTERAATSADPQASSAPTDEDSEAIALIMDEFDRLTIPKLSMPEDTLYRLLKKFDYSTDTKDSQMPSGDLIWALNLVAGVSASQLPLVNQPYPVAGLYRREMLRADHTQPWRQYALIRSAAKSAELLLADVEHLTSYMASLRYRNRARRSNSRIEPLFNLLNGFGTATAAQLARALDMSRSGALKLLTELESQHFARRSTDGYMWSSVAKFSTNYTKEPLLPGFTSEILDDHLLTLSDLSNPKITRFKIEERM